MPAVRVHVQQSVCLLCRHHADPGGSILGLDKTCYTVPKCMESCSRCEKHPTPVNWIHPLCYNLLLSTYEPCEAPSSSDLERLARATQTRYQPPDEEKRATESAGEGLFSPWAQPILQNSFNQVLFRSLPAEIQEIILTLTGPCWYLTLLGETRRLLEQVRNDWESQPEKLSLSQCVYIARTTYQGVSYISRISNILFGDRPESECIVVPPGLHRIILSIDHIGVRQIQFLTAEPDASQDHSPCYRVLDVQVDEPVLCVKSDPLFIRDLELRLNAAHKVPRIWSSPRPPLINPWNFHHSRKHEPRMHYIEIGPNAQGILACCTTQFGTLAIHVFSGVSKQFNEFCNQMRRLHIAGLYWIFFPLSKDESIQTACVHKFKGFGPDIPLCALVLQTTKQRTRIFGPYPSLRHQGLFESIPLVRNDDGVITGICHDDLDPHSTHITQIGVTCDSHHPVKRTSLIPTPGQYDTPPVYPATGAPVNIWFMTNASLFGLRKVRVCRDEQQPDAPCLGLLLYYDDYVDSLGQTRWDREISSDTSAPICIRSVISGRRGSVTHVESATAAHAYAGNDGWQYIPDHGTIIWWFGNLGNRVQCE